MEGSLKKNMGFGTSNVSVKEWTRTSSIGLWDPDDVFVLHLALLRCAVSKCPYLCSKINQSTQHIWGTLV
jgi:hypothetical protein